VILNCKVCGKEFRTYPCKLLVGKGKFCSKKCADNSFKGKHFSLKTEWVKGKMPWSFKGFRYQIARPNGRKYILLYKPDYEDSDSRGYIREHRYVMEMHLGRKLLKSEIVHHIDGNTLNNDITNLQVMDKRDHDRMNVNLNVHKRWMNRR
jgi:hypothetical protein